MPLPTTNFLKTLHLIQLAKREEGATFSEIEEKTGFTRRNVTDLGNTLQDQVGVFPFSPVDYMDFMVEGDRVKIFYHLKLARPLNLSNLDILALNLALQWATQKKLIELGTAASISKKIEATQPAESRGFVVDGIHFLAADDTPGGEFLGPISKAVQEHRHTRLTYFSQNQGETSWRTVAPFRLYLHEGVWYLRAYDTHPPHGKPDWRTFRLDRIRDVEVDEKGFNPDTLPNPGEGGKLFDFGNGTMTATRTQFNATAARYIREMVPTHQIEELEDGKLVLHYSVTGFPYFKAFVLQFGADAEVLDPAQYRDAIAEQLEQLLDH